MIGGGAAVSYADFTVQMCFCHVKAQVDDKPAIYKRAALIEHDLNRL